MDDTARNYGFRSDKLYRPRDAKMRELGSEQTLADWRHHGRGLPYTKIDGSVFYFGQDIIAFLNQRRVEPRQRCKRAPAAAAAAAPA